MTDLGRLGRRFRAQPLDFGAVDTLNSYQRRSSATLVAVGRFRLSAPDAGSEALYGALLRHFGVSDA